VGHLRRGALHAGARRPRLAAASLARHGHCGLQSREAALPGCPHASARLHSTLRPQAAGCAGALAPARAPPGRAQCIVQQPAHRWGTTTANQAIRAGAAGVSAPAAAPLGAGRGAAGRRLWRRLGACRRPRGRCARAGPRARRGLGGGHHLPAARHQDGLPVRHAVQRGRVRRLGGRAARAALPRRLHRLPAHAAAALRVRVRLRRPVPGAAGAPVCGRQRALVGLAGDCVEARAQGAGLSPSRHQPSGPSGAANGARPGLQPHCCTGCRDNKQAHQGA